MIADISDTLMRTAAFEHVRRLGEVRDHLTAIELKPGFMFRGERIPLVNPQRGIFKPQQMRYLLSIKTVFPKPGGKVWYDDQREVRLDHEDYGELDTERRLADRPNLVFAEFYYWTRKLQAHFFAGDLASAVHASLCAVPLLWTSNSLFSSDDRRGHTCRNLSIVLTLGITA